MSNSMGDIWRTTTRFERIVLGSGAVALLGRVMPAGGAVEAVMVAGPALAIGIALVVLATIQLRGDHRGQVKRAGRSG